MAASRLLIFMTCCFSILLLQGLVYGSPDAIKLSNVKTITLYHGKMTTGRRSAPVPQLKCVGGTAGCNAFIPQVVQCYNRGGDGEDAQWECKTDMDNEFRFGQISVSCEGYSYPGDPYILKGSCGLEYTIDLTKEGIQNRASKKHQSHQSHQNNGPSSDQKPTYTYPAQKSNRLPFLGTLIFFVVVASMVYGFYKTCIKRDRRQAYDASSTSDDDQHGGYPGGDPYRPSAPPPDNSEPRRRNFRRGNSESFDDCCGSSRQSGFSNGTGVSNEAASFWTGAATGSLLGYMLGNRNSNAGTTHTHTTRAAPNTRSNNSFGNSSGSSPVKASSSTGTRTASGFGGTTRR